MKERILNILVCPDCGGDLNLKTYSKENGEIKEGLLECSCGHWYPIISFVPRLLLREYRGDYGKFLDKHGLDHFKETAQPETNLDGTITQVQRSFSSKWTSQPSWGASGETKAFMKEWILSKYGWKDGETFKRALGKKRRILDAGAGLGREVMDFCEVCEEGEVFGVDISEAVEPAYLNTRGYHNAHIIQADLMKLPFKNATFDFIFSEGVLHHTLETKKTFEALLNFLTPKGEVAIYVYKKKGPIREFCDDYIRQFSTKLSTDECWEFAKKMTNFGKALSDLNIEFEIPEDIPVLEMKAGKYNLHRFFYYHVFKSFWNDRFTFDENNLINFDWYHPVNAHRHTSEEVKAWFQKAGLKLVHLDISGSGITARGQSSS